MPKHQEMVKHNMALLVPGASFENVTFNVAGTEVASRGTATIENCQNGSLLDDIYQLWSNMPLPGTANKKRGCTNKGIHCVSTILQHYNTKRK